MYKANGSYVLDRLVLVHDGIETDLIKTFLALNLFESMEDMFMSGNIAISDSFNIPDIAPLYGNEEVQMRFYTAGNEQNPIEYTGSVYKLSSKTRITEHNNGYQLFFCSKEALKSKRLNVNQYYDSTISDAVTKIYTKTLKDKKPLRVSPTKGVTRYSIGNLEPSEAINMMSAKAVSTNNDHTYIFFENNKTFVFKPLQELYRQEPVVEYGVLSSGISSDLKNRNQEQFSSIQDIKILEENSFLDRLEDGLHGSDHYMFDLVSKEYLDGEDYEYSKDSWYTSDKSLGRVPDKKPVEKSHDTVFLTFGAGDTDKQLHKNYIDSKMKLRESDMFRAEMTVFGDSTIKCGDVLKVKLPNWNVDQETIGTLFDGHVLIKKLWHMITPTTYMQVMQINKDAYEQEQI